MLTTYTLYLRGARGKPDRFEPFLGRSGGEAIGRARELLEQNPDYEAVDVCFGDTELFRVQRTG
jgi:hypothetical protein